MGKKAKILFLEEHKLLENFGQQLCLVLKGGLMTPQGVSLVLSIAS